MSSDADKADPTEDFGDPDNVFDFPFTTDEESVDFLRKHGRIFFIVRGLPGSRKKVLGKRLEELYPKSKTFWADKVFLGPFAESWTKETVRSSHKICYAKIEKFMQENVPIIINRNSNVRLFEVSPYFRLALQYGYTVVLAETGRRILADPALLRHSNDKGLGTRYLTDRKKQWAEAYPIYTGWFLRPVDGLYLLRHYARLRAAVVETGWNMPEITEPECLMFCLGRHCRFGIAEEDRAYCDDEKIKDAYGSKHTLTIFGYAVVDDVAFAVAKLDEGQKALLGSLPAKNGEGDPLYGTVRTLTILDWEETACKVKLEDVVDDALLQKEAPAESDKLSQIPGTSDISFVTLGSTARGAERRFLYDVRPDAIWKSLSKSLSISTEGIACTEKRSVSDADVFKAGDTFLAVNGKTVLLESIFTGFYQWGRSWGYKAPCSPALRRPPCKFFGSPRGCIRGPICKYVHQQH